MNDRQPNSRQSIWSVATGWLPAYFAIFDVLGTLGVFYVIGYNVFGRSHATVHDMIWTIITGIVIVGAASATVSILTVEAGKNAMIVGTYLEEMLKKRRARQMAEAREQGLEQGREQGIEQGLEQGIEQGLEQGLLQGVTKGRADLGAEVREWNARRLEAEAKGEPFDEPPPGSDG